MRSKYVVLHFMMASLVLSIASSAGATSACDLELSRQARAVVNLLSKGLGLGLISRDEVRGLAKGEGLPVVAKNPSNYALRGELRRYLANLNRREVEQVQLASVQLLGQEDQKAHSVAIAQRATSQVLAPRTLPLDLPMYMMVGDVVRGQIQGRPVFVSKMRRGDMYHKYFLDPFQPDENRRILPIDLGRFLNLELMNQFIFEDRGRPHITSWDFEGTVYDLKNLKGVSGIHFGRWEGVYSNNMKMAQAYVDGHARALVSLQGKLLDTDLVTGEGASIATPHNWRFERMEVSSAGGRALLVCITDGAPVAIYDVRKKAFLVIPGPEMVLRSTAQLNLFEDRGQLVLLAGSQGQIQMKNLETGELKIAPSLFEIEPPFFIYRKDGIPFLSFRSLGYVTKMNLQTFEHRTGRHTANELGIAQAFFVGERPFMLWPSHSQDRLIFYDVESETFFEDVEVGARISGLETFAHEGDSYLFVRFEDKPFKLMKLTGVTP